MLLIKLDEIAEVLLRDGWHRVLNRSLTVDTCQLGVRDKAGDKIPYWEDSVTWEEETSEGSKTLYSITVPLKSVLAVRKRLP